jgi:hypothetical protein
VSVKSRDGGKDYEIGKSFAKHPSDIYAFVDMTDGVPGLIYLAGAKDDREARIGTQQPVPRRSGFRKASAAGRQRSVRVGWR